MSTQVTKSLKILEASTRIELVYTDLQSGLSGCVTKSVPSQIYHTTQETKKTTKLLNLVAFFGSGGRDRTYDQLINSQLLYR